MSPAEQRDHKRVTDRLAANVTALADVVDAVIDVVDADARLLKRRTDSAFVASVQFADRQAVELRGSALALSVNLDREIIARCGFATMTFYQRLRWLLTGRTP